MEKQLKKLYAIVIAFEDKVQDYEYLQFTIDFFQNAEMKLNIEIDTDSPDSHIESLIGDLQYDLSCVLEFVKDGKDKDLFLEFEQEIKEF